MKIMMKYMRYLHYLIFILILVPRVGVAANGVVEIEETTIIGDKERPTIRLEIPWENSEASIIRSNAAMELKGVGWSAISDDEYHDKMTENIRLYNMKINKLTKLQKESEVK